MTKTVNEREIVLAVLMEVTENGQFCHIVLRDVLSKYQYLEKRERAFITRVTEGTLEHLIEIDYILDQFSKVKVKKMKPVIRNLLRSAIYQLRSKRVFISSFSLKARASPSADVTSSTVP